MELPCCGILTAGHYFNDPQFIFLRTGQVLEAPAGTSSKSISNTILEPLATKMKLKKPDLNLNSYMYLNYFLVC